MTRCLLQPLRCQPSKNEAPPPAANPLSLPRRRLLAGLPAGATLVAIGGLFSATAAAPALAAESLAARLAAAGDLQQPWQQPPWAAKQLYYPRFMFGEWQVDMTFSAVRAPLGRKLVPQGFLDAADAAAEDGGVGSTYSFRQRFYSTLPDTFENNMIVQLGLGMPRDAIIADRAYNSRQSTDAFLGYAGAVSSSEYDPSNSPLRQVLMLGTLGPDAAPLPPRRIELYINALRSESGAAGGGSEAEQPREPSIYNAGEAGRPGETFATGERLRQVMVGVRQADVTDYELLHEYRLEKDGLVTGRQRSALYLQPQQAQYFEAGGRAVAVYDYDFVMRRVPPQGDAPEGALACVPTPKGVVQCL